MVSVIGKVCKDQLTKEVTQTNYISVMADGATDVGGVENETMYSRFLRDGRPVNCLVGHIGVEQQTKRTLCPSSQLEERTKLTIINVFITHNLRDMSERNSQLQDMLEVMSF